MVERLAIKAKEAVCFFVGHQAPPKRLMHTGRCWRCGRKVPFGEWFRWL